jgi:mRNA interferase RelE/StbE
MRVVFSPLAEKQFKKFPKITQILIAKKIRQIRDQRVITNVEVLTGYKGMYRIRIGDYRFIFRKYPNSIYFVLLGHRREIYKLLSRI